MSDLTHQEQAEKILNELDPTEPFDNAKLVTSTLRVAHSPT
jgi:hypothetical protein